MDKGLMALMGIEDDSAKDEGLMERQHESREPTPFSDEDDDMEPLDITISTTKSKESRASSLSGSVDTAMTTPVKGKSQERSQDKGDPLGLFDTAMDDSDDEPLLPSTLTRSLNAATNQPSPSKPTYSNPRRNSPGPLSPHLRPAPSASTSSLFGSSGSTIRVTKSPKKPKKSNSMGGGSLFSPTLSPRKLKKSASAGFMSPTLSPARKPPPQQPRPQSLQSEQLQSQPRPQSSTSASQDSLSPSSPPPVASAFVLKKTPITFSDDSDSDISSLDDGNIFSRPPQGSPRRTDTEIVPFGDGSNKPEFTDQEVGADLVQTQVPKRISEKDRIKLRMEAERLKRSVPVPVPEIVNEKKTMSWLLQEAQNKLKQKKAPQPSEAAELPVVRLTPTKKYRTIALDDDSDDETEEQAQWKQDAARALLVAHIPKDQRLKISRDLNSKSISPEKRSEVERILQMTPLSSKIRNMSLASNATSTSTPSSAIGSTTSTASATNAMGSSLSAFSSLISPNKSLTSPSKTQKSGTVNNIHQFNELMKRQLAKKNLERRKQLEEEAKKTGTWKSPEEHAAEQLRIEEKQRKGLDPDEDEDEEEDPDYDPTEGKDIAQPTEAVDGDEEMEYASAGESGSDNESAREEEAGVVEEHDDQEVEASDEGSEEEEEEEEDAESAPEDDEDAPVVKIKRDGIRKKTVIDDDDDVRVTVVDRSQVKLSDSEQDDEHCEEGDDDNDVSDLDEDMMEGAVEEGTQGFGEFFESSYNPNRGNKQEKLAALNRAPSASPTLDEGSEEMTSSIGGALEFLSGGFPSATPRAQLASQLQVQSLTQSQSESNEAYAGISPIVEDDINSELENTLPLPSQLSAFDVLKQSATPTPAPARRRLVQRQAKPTRGPISKHDKSAFIEYEAEEEEDEFMGMGGVDYESENDNDDYDLGDGMVDANNTLDLEDVRNVKALHMKHEQEQHDKEISDLVHGIAAGNLWKRRNGQADDMDIFDEDDINGRFRRKKKLKVSEKFEKLADNPSTAAFARAFEKNIGDEDLVFLSDPEESDGEETKKSGKSKKKDLVASEDGDADMTPEHHDDEESEEELNTGKRAERLQQARLLRDGAADVVSEVTVTTTRTMVVPGEEESLENENEVDPIDEYKETMRRTKVIRNILDGFNDEVDLASQSMDLPSQRRALPSTFNLLDRIIDKGPMEESAASSKTGGTDVDVTAIARPRMLARQNSSFLSEERRTQFLSTVGEESRGGNAGNRMVKEVNRRKMAFATSKKTTDGGGSTSSSSASVITTTTTTTAISSSSDGKRVPGKVPRLPSDGSSSRLLSLLSFAEEE